MPFSENATKVLEARYLQPDEHIKGMLGRVAAAVASAEKTQQDRSAWQHRFTDMMEAQIFLPNSPTLMNAGTGRGTLSACFVIPVDDSLQEIMDAATAAALVQKFGGGTGFSLSRLRSMGSPISSTHGNACGPIAVLELLNEVSRLVTQGGKREGANMGILSTRHSDIMQFINLKRGTLVDPEKHTYEPSGMKNFNISVGADDAFMNNIIETGVEKDVPYEIADPHTGTLTLGNSSEMFHTLCQRAWETGDPGLVFMDRINNSRANPVPSLGPIDATNPCGEQPLYDWDSCNLGSINLSKFVGDFDHDYDTPLLPLVDDVINWQSLQEYVGWGVRFLDNVISVNDYTLPQIRERNEAIRRIGLGPMGWADMLYKLRVPYGSENSLILARVVSKRMNQYAWEASRDLALERHGFPMFDESIYMGSHSYVPNEWQGVPIRNATRTTIAPTGTISIIGDCSSGIEPNYALAFVRQHRLERDEASGDNVPVQMVHVNPVLQEALNEANYNEVEQKRIIDALLEGQTLTEAAASARIDIPEWMLEVFVTSHEISPIDHVKMQGAWQKNIDNAVSKTVNLPNDATPADFAQVYRAAYELGCLGVTAYRDGSRSMQVLTSTKNIEDDKKLADPTKLTMQVDFTPPEHIAEHEEHEQERGVRRRLPSSRDAVNHKFVIAGVDCYLNVGKYEDGCPGELFLTVSHHGSTLQGLTDWAAIMTSVSLQYGAEPRDIANKMIGMRFDPSGLTGNPDIPQALSIPDYIGRWLLHHFEDEKRVAAITAKVTEMVNTPDEAIQATPSSGGDIIVATSTNQRGSGQACPDCGQEAIMQSGCLHCLHCGWSNCG